MMSRSNTANRSRQNADHADCRLCRLACVAGGISRASAFVLVERKDVNGSGKAVGGFVKSRGFAARELLAGFARNRTLAHSRIPPATQATCRLSSFLSCTYLCFYF